MEVAEAMTHDDATRAKSDPSWPTVLSIPGLAAYQVWCARLDQAGLGPNYQVEAVATRSQSREEFRTVHSNTDAESFDRKETRRNWKTIAQSVPPMNRERRQHKR